MLPPTHTTSCIPAPGVQLTSQAGVRVKGRDGWFWTLGFGVSTCLGTREMRFPRTHRKHSTCEGHPSALSSGVHPEKAMARGSAGRVGDQQVKTQKFLRRVSICWSPTRRRNFWNCRGPMPLDFGARTPAVRGEKLRRGRLSPASPALAPLLLVGKCWARNSVALNLSPSL